MNKLLPMIFVVSAVALTVGCTHQGNTVALNAGAPGVYDGFYDDYYGPYYDGYWGDDGFFYFSNGVGGYRRDDGNHFRHGMADGFHGIHTGGALGGYDRGGVRAGDAGGFRAADGGFRAGGEGGFHGGGGGGRR